MAAGYRHTPTGMDGIAAKFADLQRQLDALRASAGLTSAVIGKGGILVKDAGTVGTYDETTGSRMEFGNGQIKIWQNYVNRPDAFGLIYTEPGTNNISRWFPPHDSGTGSENSFTIRGRSATGPGAAWVYSDGGIQLNAGDYTSITGGVRVAIDSPLLELYNLPSVSTATYGLGYHYNGTTWSVSLTTSSRKYKQDEQPAAANPAAILAIEPKTWRDKAQVEADPDTTERHFGVIAEDLVDLGLDHLVSFVDGEPESVKYDRIGVALIPVVQQQAAQIAALTARLDALEGAA